MFSPRPGNVFNKAHALVEAPLAVAYAKTHDMMRLAQKYGQQNLQKAIEIFKANKADFVEISGSPKKALKGVVKATNREIVFSNMTTLEELIDAIGQFGRIGDARQAFLCGGLSPMEVIHHFAQYYGAEIIFEGEKQFFKTKSVYMGFHSSTRGNWNTHYRH